MNFIYTELIKMTTLQDHIYHFKLIYTMKKFKKLSEDLIDRQI